MPASRELAISAAVLLIVASIFAVMENTGPTVAPVISSGQHLPIAEYLGTDAYETVEQDQVRYYVTRDQEGNPLKAAFVAEQVGFNGPIRFATRARSRPAD